MAEAEQDNSAGVPEWVVTYGDMMSLLLTFFIMLVSLSTIKSDEGKTRRMMDAIRRAFGPTRSKFGAPGRSYQQSSPFGKRASRGMNSRGGAQRSGRQTSGLAGENTPVSRLSDGTLIVLGGRAQFERFDTRLNDELKGHLDVIARVVGPKSNRIMIRGHATPEPLPTEADFAAAALGASLPWPQSEDAGIFRQKGLVLRDPYDLSFARACAVADYLTSKNIDRKRLIVTAAGDTELRLVTRRRSGQKWNRRVDVFLLDSYITPPQKNR